MKNSRVFFGLCLSSLLLTACYESERVSSVRPFSSSLEKSASCDDLLERLRADAEQKVRDQSERFLEQDASQRAYMEGGGGWYPGAPPTAGVGGGAGGGTGGDAGVEGPSHFTDTNTQEAGVDEPDFVKTDGERIFLVHGEKVEVFRSWPAEETAAIGAIDIEGAPQSMFLADDKLVVYSTVTYVDESSPGVGTSLPPGMPNAMGCWGPYYPVSYRVFTKVTSLDVSADEPVVLEERYLEGSFRDARRHGETLRTIIESPTWDPVWSSAQPSSYDESTWTLVSRGEFERRVDAWLSERLAEISARSLDDFLPDELVREGDELVPVAARCGSFYAPAPGQTPYGMAQVLTTSLADLGTSASVFVLGAPAIVYASDDALVLTQSDWRLSALGVGEERTLLHSFALEDGATHYRASGAVEGSPVNQFALDEAAGVLRVAVTVQNASSTGDAGGPVSPDAPVAPGGSVSRVVTLRAEGSALEELGRSVDLAPGERIYSVRYVGDKAYVVTFRTVDPLFVLDLSDPASPTLLGEVKIPGFSTYMHPLDDGHLLTIGRGAESGTGLDGMQLQVFDVSDPAAPKQLHNLVVGASGSAAEYDHKAFVFDPVTSLLAVPVETYDTSFESSLRLFHVSIEDGFSARGAIDHTPLFEGCAAGSAGDIYYSCSYTASMRRGIFIDDYIYAISYGGLTVHALADLSTPIAVEDLPAPLFYAYPGW